MANSIPEEMKNIVSEIHDAYAAKLSEPKLPSKVYLGKKQMRLLHLDYVKDWNVYKCVFHTEMKSFKEFCKIEGLHVDGLEVVQVKRKDYLQVS